MLHKVSIAGLTMDPTSNTPIIILKSEEDEKTIPIWIGLLEATSIVSALQKIKLGHKGALLYFGPELFDQLDNCCHGAACRKQIVGYNHLVARLESIFMDFQGITAIFQFIAFGQLFGRELARLAHRHKTCP